jgi:hypothetical protein
VLALACATDRAQVRPFPDQAVAWREGDDGALTADPRPNHLQDLSMTMLVRDAIPREIDRHLALERPCPAWDVNALDEIPCSTWFCARHHLRPMSAEAIAAGPAGDPPRLPLHIRRGKERGAALGYEVTDAGGRKFLLKLDPAGHVGLATGAEVVGSLLFHAAGYNVPAAFAIDVARADLVLDPDASYEVHEGKRRPLGEARLAAQLARAARGSDGRWRAVAVSWIGGSIIGAFDMIGRRDDDPNDRIPHQHRRSLRASRVLYGWLNVVDASALNTLDSVVEEDGRRYVRHHFIDFGASLGSATYRVKGPNEGAEREIEIGRSLLAFAAFGAYRRPWQDERAAWEGRAMASPALGWLPESHDPDQYRPTRTVPAHMRMTERDGYWGAKVVTAFDDEALGAAVARAGYTPDDARRLVAFLGGRRDEIGRRYLRASTAIEDAEVVAGGPARGVRLCWTDLAVARGYARTGDLVYDVTTLDRSGAVLAREVRPHGIGPAGASAGAGGSARSCVELPDVAHPGSRAGYRVLELRARHEGRPARAARVHVRAGARGAWRLAGVEREE